MVSSHLIELDVWVNGVGVLQEVACCVLNFG